MGVGFRDKLREVSPYLIQPVPAGSKMDPLLPKAKPISNSVDLWDNIFKKRKKKLL